MSATAGSLIDAGGGDDYIYGSSSSDVYFYQAGDGSDTIREDGNGDDTLVFTDSNAVDMSFSHNSGGDLVISIGAETITVIDQFSTSSRDIEEIVFADGTVLDKAGIRAKALIDQRHGLHSRLQ
ncbi:calcium-binding protein [Yoonia sp. GPGPB17]|uniref:calcium-binding protein n=1 Tax=Yoonia sp. GPGPB17 TaxID=3026147 RepID=UPI0030BCC7B8